MDRFRETAVGAAHGMPTASEPASQWRDFVLFCEQRSGLRFASALAFHEFSVSEYRRFWELFLHWSGLLVDGSPEPVCTSDDCEQATFFPNLRTSYVENLLRVDSPEDAERVAVVAHHPFRSVQRLTRAELRVGVVRVAAYLRQLGVGPGDHVAALAGNNVEVLLGGLGTAAVGAAFSCASPDMGASAVLGRFEQLEPVVLMANLLDDGQGTSKGLSGRVRDVVSRLPSLRALIALDDGPLPTGVPTEVVRAAELLSGPPPVEDAGDMWPRFPFNHPLFVLFSSGTTGRPKSIVHGAGGTLLEHVKEHRLHTDLRRHDVLLFQTSAAWMMWNWQLSALASGACIVLYDGLVTSPDALWRVVAQEQVTVFGTSPPYLQLCQDVGYSPRREQELGHLRAVLSTGSILHDWQYDWCTEHVGAVPVQSISGGSDIIGCFVLGHPELPVHRGWIQCRSLAMDVLALPAEGESGGSVGELVCRNPFPSRPLGFLGDDGTRFSEAYFEVNRGVWTHGDLIEFDDLGQARMHGRSDGVLNVRGVRIGPAEIYRALHAVPEVSDVMAVEQQPLAERGGARIVLLVVLRDGAVLSPDLSARIRREISENASPSHVPGLILRVDDLPITHSGKRSERAARDAVNGQPVANQHALRNPEALDKIQAAVTAAGQSHAELSGETTSPYAPPSTNLERSLAAIWQGLLSVDRVGIDDDFFELGGHSVLAVQLAHTIDAELGRACTLPMLFRNRTVRTLAAELHAGGPDVTAPTVLPLQPDGSDPPLFCVAGVHIYQILAERLGPLAPVYGIFLPVEQELFGQHVRRRGTERVSVERMAADYLLAVREQQPAGPYQLLGYSFGGVLAFEMARQLVAAGDEVSLLVLFDSLLPVALGRGWARSRLSQMKRIGIQGIQTFPDRVRSLRRLIGTPPADLPNETARLEGMRLRIYLKAIDRYRVISYPGAAVLLRCESAVRTLGSGLTDPTYGWGRHIERLEIRDVPGDHRSSLRPPNVNTVADVLRPRLNRESPPASTSHTEPRHARPAKEGS